MNSFRYLAQGVKAEVERQIELLALRRPVLQETLHYDLLGRLSGLRSKEEAHDYAIPEPDWCRWCDRGTCSQRRTTALPELPAAGAEAAGSELGLLQSAPAGVRLQAELATTNERALAAGEGSTR